VPKLSCLKLKTNINALNSGISMLYFDTFEIGISNARFFIALKRMSDGLSIPVEAC